jgi:hypothetical protein
MAQAEKGELRVTLEVHASGYAVEVISPDKPGPAIYCCRRI